MEDGGSPESPAVWTASEPSESLSSAHRHLSRRNGLSKLCQSRMGLSGNPLLGIVGVSVEDENDESLYALIGFSVLADEVLGVRWQRC